MTEVIDVTEEIEEIVDGGECPDVCDAAERGLGDDVIGHAGTCRVFIRSPAMFRTEHAGLSVRGHGNPSMHEPTIHRTPPAPLLGSAAGPEPQPGDD